MVDILQIPDVLKPDLCEALRAAVGVALSACKAPQFLRFGAGDDFVAHQDGATPLVFDPSRDRRVSVILFLSTPPDAAQGGDYGGGSLVFYGPFPSQERTPIAPAPGTLVAFRAETTPRWRWWRGASG